MPITKGAKKAHRSSLRKYVYNLRRKRAMRSAIKAVRDALKNGDVATAKERVGAAQKAIDKATKRGVLKENAASRTKARLSAAIKKTEAQ